MASRIKVLLLEDYVYDAELVELALKNAGMDFISRRTDTKDEFIKMLESFYPDVILADYKLSDWTAIDALKLLKEKKNNTPLILVTGNQKEEVAVESMKLGAVDYIIKDSLKRLPNAVVNTLKNKEFEQAKFEAQEALKAEYTFRKSIEESMLAGITAFDFTLTQSYVNSAFCKMTGWSKDELIGKKPPFLYWDESNKQEMLKTLFSHLEKKKSSIKYDTKFQKKNGELFYVQVLSSTMKDHTGKITGWVEVVHDVTEQKKKEEQIKVSLKEKEVLVKEIHHRVKNNLQIISSLLSLQASYLNDAKTQEVFFQSINRIKALALIHENLYKSKELTKIKFSNYVSELVNNLFINYNLDFKKFLFVSELDYIDFDIDTSINLGIIINELVSNSIKHAFHTIKNNKNIISIRLRKDNEIISLNISDNGTGIGENKDLDINKSLGLQLVYILVNQINGTYELKTDKGFEVSIKFRYVELNDLSNQNYTT